MERGAPLTILFSVLRYGDLLDAVTWQAHIPEERLCCWPGSSETHGHRFSPESQRSAAHGSVFEQERLWKGFKNFRKKV